MSRSPKADNLPLPPLPDKQYDVIAIDWPWHFRSHAPVQNAESDRSPQRHYPTMSLDYIKQTPLRDLMKPNCLVMMWMTGPLLVDGTHIDLFRNWGIRPSSMGFVWIKTKAKFNMGLLSRSPLLEGDLFTGMGFTTRQNAEFVVFGRTGNGIPRSSASVRQVIVSPVREHSRKPDEFFARAEAYADVPDRLDMFAGRERPNWDSFGWSHRDGERPEVAADREKK